MGNELSRRLAGFVVVLRATVLITFGAVIESAYATPIDTAVYDQLDNEPSLVCPSLSEHAARQPLSGRFDCKPAPPPTRETESYEMRRAADDGKPTSSGESAVFGRRRPPPYRWR